MSFLSDLLGAFEHRQPAKAPQAHPATRQLSVIQAPPQVLGNNTPQARAYNTNPTAFAGRNGVDPAQFGYGPDATLSNNAGVPHNLLFGVPNGPYSQGGMFNPGYTPLQNSGFGPQGRPQISAFSQPTLTTLDPQKPYQPY